MIRTRTARPLVRTTAVVLFAGVLGALASAGVSAAAGGTFGDVPESHPFAEDIDFMAQTGIAGGYEDGSYQRGAPVSRQAMAAFIHRSNTYVREQGLGGVTNGTYARAVARCSNPNHRVISGGGTTTFPDRVAITTSSPTVFNDGWTVTAATIGFNDVTFTVEAWAICGPVEIEKNYV